MMPKKSRSIAKVNKDLYYDHALHILRHRMTPNLTYSQEKIQQAVEIVRLHDPNHPLLRYSERGPIEAELSVTTKN